MKIRISKRWFIKKAKLEEGLEIGAGMPPQPEPNCIVRNASGQGVHLEYRHPLSLDPH